MSPKDAAVVFMMIAAFITCGWVMFLAADTRKRQNRVKAQADLNVRLLDKFGSAQEIVEFLQTPGGMQIMDNLASDRESPAAGILRFTQRGIILIVLAVGCLGLGWYYRQNDTPLLVIGVLLLCLGIGFLISA